MRRKRNDVESIKEMLVEDETLNITKENDYLVFEIGNDMTTDLAEAVSILMRKVDWNDSIWNMKINRKSKKIKSEKALFWLSGGDIEWFKLNNYNDCWSRCSVEFNDEFGFLIESIVNKANTLKEIRNGFVKYLNLPILYDFAISKNMIK